MSVETEFRALVRSEVESQLKPLQRAIEAMQESLAISRQLESSLAPVARAFAQVLQGTESSASAVPAKRGPGRPRKVQVTSNAMTATVAPRTAINGVKGKPGRKKSTEAERACAIRGCRRPARAKGYCAAHYQKLRMLTTRNQRPAAWIDFPAPQSVDDLKLPRGRAAVKARGN